MNILIVTDAYPPMRTSGACHIYDLGQAFVKSGSRVNIIVPDSAQEQDVNIHIEDGVKVIRVKALHTKDVGYLQRTIAEFLNSFLMWRRLRKNPHFLQEKIDGVVWYSPTIFWGPLIARLKKHYQAKSYLILRDIFPDWALDLGVIKKGPAYRFLKAIEKYQYRQATVIGVQSPNNQSYFVKKYPQLKNKVEVLWNWASPLPHIQACSLDLSKTGLAERYICIYAGNMGVAQGIDVLFDIARALKDQNNIGFVFVGRGSEVPRLKKQVIDEHLSNILFFDEVPSQEIPALYAQCQMGLLALDVRHQTHNIPGKFLSYLQSNLPVLAIVNPGNDLINLIQEHQIGLVSSAAPDQVLLNQLQAWVNQHQENKPEEDQYLKLQCAALMSKLFSPQKACEQIALRLGS